MSENEKVQIEKEPKYTKDEILKSSIFQNTEKDMLHILLMDGCTYTLSGCRAILKKEAKRKVMI